MRQEAECLALDWTPCPGGVGNTLSPRVPRVLLRDSFWVCMMALVASGTNPDPMAYTESPLIAPFPQPCTYLMGWTCCSMWSGPGLHFLWDLTLLCAPHHLAPIPWKGQTFIHPSPASLLLFLHPSIIFQSETLSGAASILGCVTWSQLIVELGLELEMSEVRDNLFIQVARIYWTWLGHKDAHFWSLLSRILSGGTDK